MSSRSDTEEGPFSWTDMDWGSEYGPWRYHVLSESEITSQLSRHANAEYDVAAAVASVTFQPCLNEDERSQDRRVVQSWDFGSGVWSFTAVFDGHAGHETVDHAMVELPTLLRHKLGSALSSFEKSCVPFSELISSILADSIVEYDESLLTDFSSIFPQGLARTSELSSSDIENIINDAERGGENLKKVLRCMRGSTVLISLVDPSGENLWVANLGDCQAGTRSCFTSDFNSSEAVLGTKVSGEKWKSTLLTADHNGSNEAEVNRVMDDHPGEPECITRHRILGAIAVTRALGDYEFKLPARITEEIFLLAKPGFNFKISSINDCIARNKTPPYLSRNPDVYHHKIIKSNGEERLRACDTFLIMYTDGFTDLYNRKPLEDIIPHWGNIVGSIVDRGTGQNAALELLRDALGGNDCDKVSRFMTLENTQRWMDDTTITVQKL